MTTMVLIALLTGCKRTSGDAPPTTDPSPGDVTSSPLDERALAVFDVWQELADALRESPDHREARAHDAIETGDPETMFRFVRDHVGTLPLTDDDLNWIFRSDRMAWFGPRGAIRGGLGTPRDRAEALAWMLSEAGFEAEVHWAYPATDHEWPIGDEQWRNAASLAFAPASTDLDGWAEPWGDDLSGDVFAVDVDASDRRALSSAIRGLVKPGGGLARRDIELMPVVEVQIDGEDRILNLGDAAATFDEPLTAGHARTAELRTPEVSVSVWARQAGTGDEVELVAGSWPLHDLVGRRVVYRARPVLDLPLALGTPIGDVPLFLPALSIEAPGTELGELGRVGPAFATTGDVVGQDPDTGEITVNGRALDAAEDVEGRVATVETLEVTADASRFPEVALTLRPLDDDGRIVPALGGSRFRVTDEGAPVGGWLRSNLFRPRVIVKIDGSLSIPEEWQDEQILPFARDLATGVLESSGAEIVAQEVGQIPSVFEDFTTDVDVFVDQVESQIGLSSSLWTSLDRAMARQPDLVILISDFREKDDLTPAIEARLRNASAAFVGIAVGDVRQETLDAMVEMMDGTSVTPADAAEALEVALAGLDPFEGTYELVYQAPPGLGTHEVEVGLHGHPVAATTSYEVPATPVVGRGLGGLYVTVRLEGRGEVTRTIAGLPPNVDAALADRDVLEQVAAAHHATVSLLVEGGGPGLAQVLDDELTARLGTRSLVEQLDDPDGFWETLRDGGVQPWPHEPTVLTHALSDDGEDGWTVSHGPRLVLHTLRPGFAPGDGLRRVDVLPLNRWMTLHPDPAVAWQRTFDRTLELAVVEGWTHDASTWSALAGATLVAVPAESLPEPLAEDLRWRRLADDLDDDWTLLVPTGGTPVAAWGVHEPTGTVIGLLEDGIGGGESLEERLERSEAIFDLISQLHGMSGLGGGIWLELEIAKAKIVAYATLAIANLEGWGTTVTPDGPTPEEVVEGFVCSHAEGTIVDALPASVSEGLELYGSWVDALGLPPASVCP